jgi:NAD(P)-dependent dehydrogenase (short-subunit alcohol dehydrogenase family)
MKRALVTGASGSIGAAIAAHLAAAGHHVYLHANGQLERAQVLATEILAHGGRAEALRFDVTKPAETAAAVEGILVAGPIQILVNNAGIHDDAVMPGMRPDQWARVIDVSLNGFFNVTQPLLMPMIRTRWPGELRGGQGWAARRDARAVAGTRQPWDHRQHGRARHHRFPGDGDAVPERDDRPHGADAAGGHAVGGRGPRGLSRLRPRRLHLRPDHLHQWRDGLTTRGVGGQANFAGRAGPQPDGHTCGRAADCPAHSGNATRRPRPPENTGPAPAR